LASLGPIKPLAGVLLVAGLLGCDSRSLSGGTTIGVVAGTGGSFGKGGNPGRGGTDSPSDDGGGGASGASGRGGATGASTGSGGDPCATFCGTVPCPARAGQPRVLVTSPFDHQIGAIAVSAETIYWGTYPNQTSGEVRSMPLAGGPSTLLVENVIVSDMLLDGSTLYYVANDRSGMAALFALPVTGGTSRIIATGSGIGFVTSDASGIYFAQKSGGGYRIVRADRAGSGVTPLLEVMGTLWGFVIEETNIYWASYSNGGGLYRRSLAGGDTTTLRISGSPITSPVSDGADIDFVEGISTPATCQSAIWSIAKAGGGTPRLLSPGTSGNDVWRPVRDEGHLYWAKSNPHGEILRTVRGQTPEILAADQSGVGQVILGPTDVYWIAGTGSAYEVRTLPK
jgi:hypothetical protein